MGARRFTGGAAAGAVRTEEQELTRGALQRAVERSSLREVARQTEMSPSGLQGVCDGSRPYGKTAVKLRVWYALHADEREAELGPETALSLVDTLLRQIPDSRRTAACSTRSPESSRSRAFPRPRGCVAGSFGLAADRRSHARSEVRTAW